LALLWRAEPLSILQQKNKNHCIKKKTKKQKDQTNKSENNPKRKRKRSSPNLNNCHPL
jgi:hypothetical protein